MWTLVVLLTNIDALKDYSFCRLFKHFLWESIFGIYVSVWEEHSVTSKAIYRTSIILLGGYFIFESRLFIVNLIIFGLNWFQCWFLSSIYISIRILESIDLCIHVEYSDYLNSNGDFISVFVWNNEFGASQKFQSKFIPAPGFCIPTFLKFNFSRKGKKGSVVSWHYNSRYILLYFRVWKIINLK